MKIIYETSDYPDVLIKKGMLEQAGFLVHVDNLNSAGGAMPELGFTVGYRIMVPDDEVSAAERFLNSSPVDAGPVSALERAQVPEAAPPLVHPWFLASVALLLLWLIVSDLVSL